MKISACLIVKNEEKNIERCLASVKKVADEIVVVDTGSKDRTIDLAKQFTDKIFRFKWNNDFAEARNYALSHSTGDWIISIDADEIFHSNIDLRSFLETLPDDIGALEIKILSQTGDSFTINRLPKIFRKGCYFSNKVHETIIASIEKLNLKILPVDSIYFIHTGYTPDNIVFKRKRNLEILKKAIQKEPENRVYHFYLAQGILLGLYTAPDVDYAVKLLENIIANPPNDNLASESLKVLIKYFLIHDPDKALPYIQSLEVYDKQASDVFAGTYYYIKKDWERCYQNLHPYTSALLDIDIGSMSILSALNTRRYEEGISIFRKLPVKTPNAYVYTAMCYKRLGDNKMARKLSNEALNFNPLNPLAVSLINLIDEEEYVDRSYKILVVSPVRQDPDVLKVVLDSWRNLKTDKHTLEFFFVDNNEHPLSSKLLEQFDAPKTILKERPDLPYVRSNLHHWNYFLVEKVAKFKNTGIRYALSRGFDYVFFLDSDLELHPDVLLELLKANKPIISGVFWTKAVGLEYPQVWLQDQISCYQVWARENDLTEEMKVAYKNSFYEVLKKENMPIRVGGLGACTLVKREPLERGVNFDPIYNVSFFGEDRWFCIRAVALGYDLWAHPLLNAPIIHHYV